MKVKVKSYLHKEIESFTPTTQLTRRYKKLKSALLF